MSEFNKWLVRLTANQRLDFAAVKTNMLVDLTRELIGLHATARGAIYSNVLSSQLQRTYGANAFEMVRLALFQTTLIKLSRLWDAPGQHTYSIPTVWALVSDPEVQRLGQVRHLGPSPDAFHLKRRARNWSCLNRLLTRANRSPLKRAVVNYRDRVVAHFLDATRREVKGEVLPLLRYGDERRLLDRTAVVIRALHSGVLNASFDWIETRAEAERDARAFWEGLRFQRVDAIEDAPISTFRPRRRPSTPGSSGVPSSS